MLVFSRLLLHRQNQEMLRILTPIFFLLCSFSVSAQFNAMVFSDSCENTTVSFSTDTTAVDSALWSFGDPASGTADTTSILLPSHVFSDTGIFIINLSKWVGGVPTIVTDTIRIYPLVSVDLGLDTTLCQGQIQTFDLTQSYASFIWQDGSLNSMYAVTQDSLIRVTVTGACDTLSDTVQVSFDQSFTFNLGPDTSYCGSQSIALNANINVPATIAWNTGQTVDSINVSASGQYILSAFNVCDTLIDTVVIGFLPSPDSVLLPADTVNCLDQSVLVLRPQNDSISYMWSDSSTSLTYQVDSSSQIWLSATNDCGTVIDTMNIVFNGEITTDLGDDTTICYLDSIMLVATTPDPSAVYLWNNGRISDTIFTEDVDKLYSVTITAGACSKVSTIRVDLNELACPSIDCDVTYDNVFSPNGDGINDIWRIQSTCDIYKYDLRVYNRWGQLVHYSDRIKYGWDGSVNGLQAATGTYFFVMEFVDGVVVNVDRSVFRGSLTLVR
jgi:gliding motility-associated-like protein